ncbi:MAG: hypothetical protein ABSD90_06040 [Methylocystis sp.]|jgi:hypothetical protein
MADGTVILPAYIDEAGVRGLVRDLKPERDHEISVMCALLFEPDGHANAIQAFKPAFEEFRDAMPYGAKLHITDAFKPGNEAWAEVAKRVRIEFIRLIKTIRPMVIYSARRLRLSRTGHVNLQNLKAAAIVLDSHLDPDGFQFVNRKFR